jgi:hypothetical protein
MLRQCLKTIGAPLAQNSLRQQRENPTHGVLVGAASNALSCVGATLAHNINRARIPEHPLCASSALPSATLASAPLTTMRIRP